jgi:hypothetical protein
MSKKDDDNSLLLKDESFIKFERLLHRAEKEGRIDGPFSCLVCGMRYQTKSESVACCNLATDPPAPTQGVILGSLSKTRAHASKNKTRLQLKVAENASAIGFEPDGAMQETLNTLNIDALFNKQIIRTADNDQVLLILLLSKILKNAGGDHKYAYQIACQNGLKMSAIKWGMMIFRLVRLGVLVLTIVPDNSDSQPGESVENEKESKE